MCVFLVTLVNDLFNTHRISDLYIFTGYRAGFMCEAADSVHVFTGTVSGNPP